MVRFFLFFLCFWPCSPSIGQEPESSTSGFRDKWKYNGWVDFTGFNTTRESDETKWDVAHLYLVNTIQFSSKLEVLIEIALENEFDRSKAKTSRDLELERAYIQYNMRSELKFRIGRFYTPMGIYKQRHWAYTMDTFQKPIIEENQYIPANALGLEIFGTRFLAHGSLNYTLLFSDGNQDDATVKPIDDQFGFGSDVNYNYNDVLLVGGSFYRYRSEQEESLLLNASQLYVESSFWEQHLVWRMEWLFLERTGRPETDGYYTQLKWNTSRNSYLNLRIERSDDDLLSEGTEHGAELITIGLRFPPTWKIKLEYAWNSFEDERFSAFEQWAIWVGYGF